MTDRGASHLAVLTSVGCPTRPSVERPASGVEFFDFFTFNIDEPPGLAEGGLYVDPVYF